MHVEPFDGEMDATAVAVRLCGRPGLVWLDADGVGERGRYAFVACNPVEVRRRTLGEVGPLAVLDDLGDVDGEAGQPTADGPSAARVPRWAGYLAYDAAWAMGPWRRGRRRGGGDIPVAWFARYDAWACFDLAAGQAWLVGDDAGACARLRDRLERGEAAAPVARVGPARAELPADHLAAIRAALGHIAAGDVYQVNLARAWRASFEGTPLALALAMRRASPVPLGFFVDAGDHAVVSRTMETFLAQDAPGAPLRSRPIKGTIARRGDDAGEAAALSDDAKERAEHAMIVDLVRNDLSRVAEVGSVRIDEVMRVEPYAKLSHLVSTVTCTPRPGTTPRQVLEATFPPGSVTGTPKVRAVELIDTLEPSPRGVYCGAVGHVSRTGGMRWAVAIRTARIARGEVTYHAGGGIVEASNPDRELAETELKARVFLDAVGEMG